jgi:mono/diheme cytochrome c family protein
MVRAFARAAGVLGLGLALAGCPGFGDRTLEELVDGTPTWEAQVRPVFEQHCWSCHGEQTAGGAPYSLTTYEQAVMHADAIDHQVVVENRMPPGVGLPTPERAVVAAWLQGGTPRGEATADAGVPAPDAAPPPDLGPAPDAGAGPPPTWNGEIGPLLVAGCATEFCHDVAQPSAGLDLSSYAGFQAGGFSGDLAGGGDPAQSLLVKRLRGVGGSRMPLTGDPFTEAQIRLCEAWIRAGAPEAP